MAKTPITNFQEGVTFLKEHGKFEDNKFKLEKSATREFFELTGASAPVQEAYEKASTLLHRSLYALGADMLKSAVIEAKKKKDVTPAQIADTTVQLTALGHANTRIKGYAQKEVRLPASNETVTKYGVMRYVTQVNRTGVTKSDIDDLSKELQDLLK